MNARTIIEAETPKKALRMATPTNPAFDEVDRALAAARWTQVGGHPHQWEWIDKWNRDRGVFYGLRVISTGDIVTHIWWDGPAREWVFKRERKRRDGYEDLGFRVFKSGADLLRHLKGNYFLREAENPKKALTAVVTRRLKPLLLKSRFVPHGSGFKKEIKHRVTGQRLRYTVWYDRPEREWVVKRERFAPGRQVWIDDYEAFKSEENAINYLKTLDYVLEAENPKKALRAVTDPNNLDALLKRIQREEEIEHTPREDSWQPGQRIRRIQHNPFGARPFGGNPNDIGDTGTVVRFLRRMAGRARAEYVCYWDRRPLSSDWVDHTKAEAIPGEFDQLDQWGRPPVRPIREAETPKKALQQSGRQSVEKFLDANGFKPSRKYREWHERRTRNFRIYVKPMRSVMSWWFLTVAQRKEGVWHNIVLSEHVPAAKLLGKLRELLDWMKDVHGE